MNDVLVAIDEFEIVMDGPMDRCPSCEAPVDGGIVDVEIVIGRPVGCRVCGAVLILR